jgi:hypothetical protein
MNLRTDQNRTRRTLSENSGLWQDARLWWVNCVAVEAVWSHAVIRGDLLAEVRQQRDAMLASLLGKS